MIEPTDEQVRRAKRAAAEFNKPYFTHFTDEFLEHVLRAALSPPAPKEPEIEVTVEMQMAGSRADEAWGSRPFVRLFERYVDIYRAMHAARPSEMYIKGRYIFAEGTMHGRPGEILKHFHHRKDDLK